MWAVLTGVRSQDSVVGFRAQFALGRFAKNVITTIRPTFRFVQIASEPNLKRARHAVIDRTVISFA